MTRRLVLYEDRHWRDLRPLTDLVPVHALTFGASDVARRWLEAAHLPLLALEARPGVLAAWRDAPPVAGAASAPAPDDEVLAVNAAALPGAWLDAVLAGRAPGLYMGSGDQVAAARVPWRALAPALGRGDAFETALLGLGLPAFPATATFLRFPWHLIEHQAEALASDLAARPAVREGEIHPAAVLLAPERITVEAGARVDALAVLDARGGPVRVERNALVLPHTHVVGPCRVGAGTQLLGGVIGNSTIGPGCRIAGEVDACVWQGWANKRHHGFVGHSAIGPWVNLGALTTTSDLKNTYGEVRARIGGREIATGTSKLGSVLGAHVKTGIGTLLPTGAVIGTGANLFGGGRFGPKDVPPFAWWDGERAAEHELERFLATARTALGRRDQILSPAEEQVLRALHAATRAERGAPA
jgi:UDP-N-acetylglucosamine diphosphorylase/glucosamine-1-phosphate N-acetyltransferase